MLPLIEVVYTPWILTLEISHCRSYDYGNVVGEGCFEGDINP